MHSTAEQGYTAGDYLVLERQSETKNEFFDGQIFAMADASLAHNRICSNLGAALKSQLRTGSCESVGSDMRVKCKETGLYTYPDAVVFCGTPILEDAAKDTLLNPKVVFEVLSPSTERYDRGTKFVHYRTIDTLTDYVLITQDGMRVEHFVRSEDGTWSLSEFAKPQDTLTIASIDCKLPLAEIYERVDFGPRPPLREPYPPR